MHKANFLIIIILSFIICLSVQAMKHNGLDFVKKKHDKIAKYHQAVRDDYEQQKILAEQEEILDKAWKKTFGDYEMVLGRAALESEQHCRQNSELYEQEDWESDCSEGFFGEVKDKYYQHRLKIDDKSSLEDIRKFMRNTYDDMSKFVDLNYDQIGSFKVTGVQPKSCRREIAVEASLICDMAYKVSYEAMQEFYFSKTKQILDQNSIRCFLFGTNTILATGLNLPLE